MEVDLKNAFYNERVFYYFGSRYGFNLTLNYHETL